MYSNLIFNFFFRSTTSRLDGTVENLAICEIVCGVNGISVSSVVCVSSTTEKHFTISTISTSSLSIQYQITKIKMYKETLCTLWKWLCYRTRLVLLLLLPPPHGSTERDRENVCWCVSVCVHMAPWHICIMCGESNRAHGHIRSIGQTTSATTCIQVPVHTNNHHKCVHGAVGTRCTRTYANRGHICARTLCLAMYYIRIHTRAGIIIIWCCALLYRIVESARATGDSSRSTKRQQHATGFSSTSCLVAAATVTSSQIQCNAQKWICVCEERKPTVIYQKRVEWITNFACVFQVLEFRCILFTVYIDVCPQFDPSSRHSENRQND